MPYAHRNNGLFELKEFVCRDSGWVGVQALVTPKGREAFRLLVSQSLAKQNIA